jgi:uncharacterized protein YkwD
MVGVPLVAVTTLSVLGSHPGRPVAALPPAPGAPLAALQSLHSGAGDFGRFPVLATPTPTTAPPTVVAPAAPPAPAAARPAPIHAIAPRPPLPPVSGVGGAARVEFSLVNGDRAASGVASLAYSAALGRVAQYRAQDMLNRNYFSHYDPSTGQLAFVQLLHLWGIPYSSAGENIAWSTNPSMAGINTMFMNSPDHRANILNGGYHRGGIGVASNGAKTMVVEVFSN